MCTRTDLERAMSFALHFLFMQLLRTSTYPQVIFFAIHKELGHPTIPPSGQVLLFRATTFSLSRFSLGVASLSSIEIN